MVAESDLAKGILARIEQVAFVFLLQAVLMFGAAGRLDWLWAWVFMCICILSVSINALFISRINRETIAERGLAKKTKEWDKILSGLWALSIFVAVPLVAGLDARFGWTGALDSSWNIAGAVMLAFGLGVAGWAMISNAFFSTAVRIQTERGHVVCRSGPYQFIRHPGYFGFLVQSMFTPILLGSFWALIAGIAGAALLVIRTLLEDRMLQAELPGYREYAQEIRYRLMPGIW
jgi:protein-S-isoprenylcysteine O-methyltransferase Ste14